MRTLFLCVVVVGLAFSGGCHHSAQSNETAAWPADSQMRTKFEDNRGDFEKLASMSQQDSKIWQITPTFARVDMGAGKPPREAKEEDLPAARFDAYKSLFLKLGLPKGILREKAIAPEKGKEQIFFPIYVQQTGSDDSLEKGLLYSEESLPEQAAASELTAAEAAAKKPGPIYKAISGNWYLYARYNE